MADSAVTPNVFLDTEVFDAHQLDFASPNIKRVARLVASGKVKLLLTTVTKREVLAHLKEKAAETARQIKAFRKHSRVMRKALPDGVMDAIAATKPEQIEAAFATEFEDFIRDTATSVLPVDHISSEEVLARYFGLQPPFSEGRKKSEFPDAISFCALQAWIAANPGEKVYVVSNDGDWVKACKENASLIHVAKLDELLQLFADSVLVGALLEALRSKQNEIEEAIVTEVGEVGVYPGDNLIDGETDDPAGRDVKLGEMLITEAKDGRAAASVNCTLTVEAYVEAADPNSAVYDSDHKSYVHVGRIGGWVEREFERTVEVSFTYDPKRPEKVDIDRIRFNIDHFDMGAEHDELSRDYVFRADEV